MNWYAPSIFALILCIPAAAFAGFGRVGSEQRQREEEHPHTHAQSPPSGTTPNYTTPSYTTPSYTTPSPSSAVYLSDQSSGSYAPTVPVSRDPSDHVFGYLPLPARHAEPRKNYMIVLATEGQYSQSGGLLGARLSIDGRPLGLSADLAGVFLPVAGSDLDVVILAHAHATFLLVSSPYGRLRAEVGAHIAVAPLATFVAPGVAISASVHLAGPWGMEMRVQGNPWPYTEVDVRGGLALSAGHVGLSVGARLLYLNDNGALGAVNANDTDDLLVGPYFGLTFLL